MIEDQPPPVINDRASIQSLVRTDLEAREEIGRQRYGTPLQAFNGRDALVDAYQEALDLAIYLRQVIEERTGDPLSPGPTDQSKWPAHLRDDALWQECRECKRRTWDTEEFNRTCRMRMVKGGRPCWGFIGPMTHRGGGNCECH